MGTEASFEIGCTLTIVEASLSLDRFGATGRVSDAKWSRMCTEFQAETDRMFKSSSVLWHKIAFTLFACLGLTHCVHDTYQQRADLIKEHSEAFYSHLKANRVEAAIRENEMIEAMAGQMGDTVKKTAARQGTSSVEREFALMKTANEAAATNWLALGQYFAIKKQYPQARATYQRVVDTYTNPTDRPYREQAMRALKDLDILNPAAPAAVSQ